MLAANSVYSYNLSTGVYFYWIGLPIPAGRTMPCANTNMAALFMGETRAGYYPANYTPTELSGLAWAGTNNWDNPLNAIDDSALGSIWYTMVDSSGNPIESVTVDTPNTLLFYFTGPECGGIPLPMQVFPMRASRVLPLGQPVRTKGKPAA